MFSRFGLSSNVSEIDVAIGDSRGPFFAGVRVVLALRLWIGVCDHASADERFENVVRENIDRLN